MALRPPPLRTAWARAGEAAFEAAISVAIGVVAGYYADRWLGTEPVFLFFFLIVGGIAGTRRLLRVQIPTDSRAPEDTERDRTGSGP